MQSFIESIERVVDAGGVRGFVVAMAVLAVVCGVVLVGIVAIFTVVDVTPIVTVLLVLFAGWLVSEVVQRRI